MKIVMIFDIDDGIVANILAVHAHAGDVADLINEAAAEGPPLHAWHFFNEDFDAIKSALDDAWKQARNIKLGGSE